MPIIRLAQRHFVSIKMKNTLGLEDNPFDPKTVKPVCRAGQPILMDADPTLRELVCDNLAHFAECEERIRSALFDKDRPGEVARDLIFIILGVQGSGRSTLASSIHLHIHGGMPAERREWQEFLLVFETSPAGATELEISAKFKTLRDNISTRFRSGPGKALVLIDKLPQVFVKPAKTKIAADTLCLDAFRRLPAGAVKEQHRRQPKLPREMIDNFDWRVAVVIEKSAMVRSMQSCRAKRQRWSAPRHWMISATSAGVRLQCARSSSLGSADIAARGRVCALPAKGSSADIQGRALQVSRQIITRWPRVDGGRIERIMAEQVGKINKFSRIISQVAERKCVPQGVRRNGHPLEPGTTREAGDNSLDCSHRHSRIAAADKQRCVLIRDDQIPLFKKLVERAPDCCIQRYLARLETLAVTDAHTTGTIVHSEVGNAQRCDFADSQPRSKHELGHRVIPRGEAVRGGPGGTQQRMHFNIGETGRLLVTHSTHRPDIARGIGCETAGALCPPA